MPERETWHNVGRKIRHLRKTHQLTIKQLAGGCGISPNAISLLERGEVAPTIATLCKIAAALGAPVSSFFQEVCPNEIILTRGDPLAQTPVDKAVRTFSCIVSPPGSGPEMGRAGGREMVLCLSGQIEYEVDGQSYQLEPGDTLSFNGQVLHCWRNCGLVPAAVVMVLYPESDVESEGA